MVAFWDAYRTAFRGRVEKLQRDYFVSPVLDVLLAPDVHASPPGSDRGPRRHPLSESGDRLRQVELGEDAAGGKIVGKFMLGDDFQGAIRSRLTAQTLRGIEASYQRMPAFFDDVGWRRFREHAQEYIKDETLSPHDETPCTIMSMNARMGGFPDEVAKRCLLIYSSASLPSDDEGGRIAMSDRLSSIEPTTHLYRRYLQEVLDHLDESASDWLMLSSEVLSRLLSACGHDPAWAKPIAWEAYASTRYDALREQLLSLLDSARRHSSRPPPDAEGWYAEGDRIWVRVGANSFGHPDFEWRDLPTYMLHEHESRAAEFVLDLQAVESFLDRKLATPRWRIPIWSRSPR